MVRLGLLVVGFGLLVNVSSTFIKFSHGSEPTHIETNHEWAKESHHEDEGKFKIKKKWSWLPSWPWKKHKKEEEHSENHSHEKHETTHYPIWKIHKYKGIEVRPITLVEKTHQNHNYHPEIVHHEQHHWDDHKQHEIEKDVMSSFVGEGHTIETLQKMMPAFHKDKKFFDKFKKFHTMKAHMWGGHNEPHHNWPKHAEDLQAHGSEQQPTLTNLPEAADVNLPGIAHLPIPDLPYLDEGPILDSYGKIAKEIYGHGSTPIQTSIPVAENHPVEPAVALHSETINQEN